jgi:hypothetical protein
MNSALPGQLYGVVIQDFNFRQGKPVDFLDNEGQVG